MAVRPAESGEAESITTLLDSAMLQTDPERTREAVAAGRAFVAVADGRLVGAAVCLPAEMDGLRIDAIAVRRRRRGQGIGSALVDAVSQRADRVVVAFDPSVRPFYEKLGFDIETRENERLWGVRE